MQKYQIKQIFDSMTQQFDLNYPQYGITSSIVFNHNVYQITIGGFKNTSITQDFNLRDLLVTNNQLTIALTLLNNVIQTLANFNELRFKQNMARQWMKTVTSTQQFLSQKPQVENYINELTDLDQYYYQSQMQSIQSFMQAKGY